MVAQYLDCKHLFSQQSEGVVFVAEQVGFGCQNGTAENVGPLFALLFEVVGGFLDALDRRPDSDMSTVSCAVGWLREQKKTVRRRHFMSTCASGGLCEWCSSTLAVACC